MANEDPVRRAPLLISTLLALALLPGCSGSTTGGTGTNDLVLTVIPNPVTAQASTLSGYAWDASFTLNLTESVGTGVTLQAVSAIVKEVVNGSASNKNNVLSHVDVANGGQHIAANGSGSVAFVVDYTLPGGGRTATIHIVVQGVDDNGNLVASALDFSVN